MESYARFKNSGIDWIGEIPEGWEINRNKHLNSLFGRIGWQGLSSDEYIDEGPKLITGVNFSKGRIDWDSCVSISEKRWSEAEQIQIKEDDLLITKDGTVGKVAMATNCPEKASLNSGVLLIRPTTNKASKRYLFWMLQSNVFWGWFSNTNAGNSTIIHLYQSSFADMPLLLPSIEEQETIAAFLDTKTKEIDLAVEAAERSIVLLHEYRQSIITEAVTHGLDPNAPMKTSGIEWVELIPDSWQVSSVRGVTSLITNGYVGPTRDLFHDSGVRYIQSLHIVDGKLNFDKHPYYVSEKWSERHERSVLKEGDVLVVQTGAIGNCAYVDKEYEGCNCHALIILRPNENEMVGKYLYYYLAGHVGREKMLITRTGTTHPHLNSTKIQFVQVVMPPICEQNEIAAYLDTKTAEIDNLIASKTRQVELLREYRKSIISEAVTGKFKVPGLE